MPTFRAGDRGCCLLRRHASALAQVGASEHPLRAVKFSARCAEGDWCSVSKLAALWKHMGRTQSWCFPPRPDMGAVFQERGKASGTCFPGDCVHLLEGQPGGHESPGGGSPSLMRTFGGHTHGPQLHYLLVPTIILPPDGLEHRWHVVGQAQASASRSPGEAWVWPPHSVAPPGLTSTPYLRVDSALLWRSSLLSEPLCAWPAGAPQMKPCCCPPHRGSMESSVLSSPSRSWPQFLPHVPADVSVSCQLIFLQPHSTHGVAAQAFQGCLVACICHFCKPACPSWVLRTVPLAPLQPFASQSPSLRRAWKTYEGTLLAFPPIVLSPCRTSLSFRVWPWFPFSLDLSLISILFKSYSQLCY